jgi:hypothetical protein
MLVVSMTFLRTFAMLVRLKRGICLIEMVMRLVCDGLRFTPLKPWMPLLTKILSPSVLALQWMNGMSVPMSDGFLQLNS